MSIPGLIRGVNLGNEFDVGVLVANRIKLKVGAGLSRAVDGTISATVTAPPMCAVVVDAGQDINDTGTVAVTSSRTDTGWSVASPDVSFAGSPDRVRIEVQVHQAIANASNIQRPAPVLELYRNGVIVATSASGYIRDATDHEESSNTIVFTDPAPGTNPVYQLRSRQETNQGGVVSVVGPSSASFEAVSP